MSSRAYRFSARRSWLALPLLVACGGGDGSSLDTTDPSAGGASGTGGAGMSGSSGQSGAGGTIAAAGGSAGTSAGSAGADSQAGEGGLAGAAGASGTAGTAGAAGTSAGGTGSAGGDGFIVPAQARPLVEVGWGHSCARLVTGQLTCWGLNNSGQLGLGEQTTRGDHPGEMGDNLPPIDLGAGARVVAMAAAYQHTCAVLDTGAVKCWGGKGNYDVLGIAGGLAPGCKPGEMGDNLPTVNLGTGIKATSIDSMMRHTCAVLSDGRLKCWGANDYGQLGLGDHVARGTVVQQMGDALPYVDLGTGARAVAVAAGDSHTCALLETGRVKCWGLRALPLGEDGSYTWGDKPGQMGDALPFVDLGTGAHAVAIAAGNGETCALLDGGQVKCWGSNHVGQLGLGDKEDRGDQPGEMGDNLPFVDLGTDVRAVSLSVGNDFSCAVLDDGRVKCWGALRNGIVNLGDEPGDMGDALPFVDLGTDAHVEQLSAGLGHTCALLTDGKVKCWGNNNTAQLGLGDTKSRGDKPAQMGDNLPFVSLSSAVGP